MGPAPSLPAVGLRGVEGHLVLDRLQDGVVAVDSGNRIVYCNPAAADLLGYDEETLLGRPLVTVIPERLREAHLAAFAHYLLTGEGHIIGRPVSMPALRSDGSEIDLELTVTAVPRGDDEGDLFIAVLRDSSLRAELDRQRALTRYLRVTNEVAARLGFSGEADTIADAAPLVLEAIGAALDWDIGALWMVDEGEELACVDVWRRPGFEDAGFEALTRVVRFPRGKGLPGRTWMAASPVWFYDVVEDLKFPRGPVAAQANLHTGFGFPITLGGTVLGVVEFFSTDWRAPDEELMATTGTLGAQLGQFVERKRAEHDARFQAALLAAEYEASIDGVIALSPTGRVLSWNTRFLELAGLSAVEISNADATSLTTHLADMVLDADDLLGAVVAVDRSPDEHTRFEARLVDGRVVDIYTTPLRGEHGHRYGRVWYVRDVTEDKRAAEQVAHLARTLQASLLPPDPPSIPGLEIAARYQPTGTGNQVGGDFYDVFPTRGSRWAAVVGDVCGTGPEAAALTALARHTIRAAIMRARRPTHVLRDLNQAVLRHDLGERFLTAAVAFLRMVEGSLDVHLATGGHPFPLVVRHDGQVETVGRAGTIIGIVDHLDVFDDRVRLLAGDSIVFYTDGVTEARDATGQLLDEEGLVALVGGRQWRSADELVAAIVDHVLERSGGEAADDVAVLALRVPIL